MKKHLQSEALSRGLKRATKHAGPFAGAAFRATSVQYANRDDLLTGQGAKRAGARWNPAGSFAAVYLGLTPETALAETLAQHRHFGWADEDAMPFVMVGLEVSLQTVLDLADGEVRRALAVSDARMLNDPWRKAKAPESLTQAIGRLAFEAGLEGIVVPSAAARGTNNLVVFPGNLTPPGSYLRVVNRDQLPPPPDRKD
jgi:RES domain-containing protein